MSRQLLQLSRVARLSWGLATLEYDRLVVSSLIKNIDFHFGRPFPFPFPRFRVFQLPYHGQDEMASNLALTLVTMHAHYYMGHSMSNQRKKIFTLIDLNETWFLYSVC